MFAPVNKNEPKSKPMTSPLVAAVVAVGLFTALPSQAQFAFNYVAPPKEALPTTPREPEAKRKPAATKLIYGVVQGEQGVLAGATVWLQGSRTIAVTNSEGEFELRVPAGAKSVKLVCAYGGLEEEVVTMAPVKAMGSFYLLRTKPEYAAKPLVK
jgi:hypothetical protein